MPRRKSNQQPKANAPIRATTFTPKSSKRSDTSRLVIDEGVYNLDTDEEIKQSKLIPMVYAADDLYRIKENSNIIPQCIESYITNIILYGYRVVPISENIDINEEEKELLDTIINNANLEESLATVNAKCKRDYETYGFSFKEIIRNRAGTATIMKYAKSSKIRIMSANGKQVKVSKTVPRGKGTVTITEFKRFRKYVQEVNGKKVYFKEFGDTRIMDYRTGQYQSQSKDSQVKAIPLKYRATEILHERQQSEDAYGAPRWVSQLPSILGSREAEEVNLRYFEDNTVPPMILSVAGGRLTQTSFLQLKELIENGSIGKDRQNKIMLIEAVPETDSLDGNKGSVSLKVDKLTDARQGDGLFSQYDEANISKIRSSFRLPPALIGLSEQVNFATAQTSIFVAETQVFSPQRSMHDEYLNKMLVNHPQGFGLKTVKLESRGPSITNPEQIVKTLTALNVMGGVTPRSSIAIINEALQLSLPPYPEKGEEGYEEWMDKPVAFELKSLASSKDTDVDFDEEGQKDKDTKDVEEDGDTGVKQPEPGTE